MDKNNLQKLALLLTALCLTLLSFGIQRYGTGVTGNVCGPQGNEICYGPVLQGGWPLAYVIDNTGVSPVGHLSLFLMVDHFVIGAFLLDVFIYALILIFAWMAVRIVDGKKNSR